MLGRNETRIHAWIYCQTIQTVRDISQDDRTRMATCSLRTPTDRLKENYSIDGLLGVVITREINTIIVQSKQHFFKLQHS